MAPTRVRPALRILALIIFSVASGWYGSRILGRHGDRSIGYYATPSDTGSTAGDSITEEQIRELERMRSLAYLSNCRAATRNGVLLNDDSRTSGGFNLMVGTSPPGAILLDMEGNEVHRWSFDLRDFEVYVEAHQDTTFQMLLDSSKSIDRFGDDFEILGSWTSAEPMPDGGLLVLIRDYAMMRIDRDSHILWIGDDIHAHHSFHRAMDGTIYAIGTDFRRDSLFHDGVLLLDDFVSIMDSNGHEQRRIHVREAIGNSQYSTLLSQMGQMEVEPIGDFMHVNFVEYIEDSFDVDISPLKAGTILLSIRHLNLVCAIDPVTASVYWAESDFWTQQHSPTLLDNGNLLVFNNDAGVAYSSVLEYDPGEDRIVRSFDGNGDYTMLSRTRGFCQPLQNGNWLITESQAGRAVEVDPEGEIVWEYMTPYRDPGDENLTAVLYSVTRVGSDWVDSTVFR